MVGISWLAARTAGICSIGCGYRGGVCRLQRGRPRCGAAAHHLAFIVSDPYGPDAQSPGSGPLAGATLDPNIFHHREAGFVARPRLMLRPPGLTPGYGVN